MCKALGMAGRWRAPLAIVASIIGFGCGSVAGGGGELPWNGGTPGTPCDPAYQSEGCRGVSGGIAATACGADKTWTLKQMCAAGETCLEEPGAAPGSKQARCAPTGFGAGDASGGGDGQSTAGADGHGGDGGLADASGPDVTWPDAVGADATSLDATSSDTSAPDTSSPDTMAPDTLAQDTTPPDTASQDAGPLTKPLPKVSLKDISPASPTFGQTIGLELFAGKQVVVLMGAGWCASCNAQADFMEKIRKDLEAKGRDDFVMIVINDHTAASASNQKAMVTCDYSVCSPQGAPLGYPVLQATTAYGWKSFVDPTNNKPGAKNDCFVYAKDGSFQFKHVGKPTVNLTQFDKEIRSALAQ